MPPYGIAPAVAFLGAFDHVVFIDFDAEARPIRNCHIAVQEQSPDARRQPCSRRLVAAQ